MLTIEQFSALTIIHKHSFCDPGEISEKTGLTAYKIKQTLKELKDLGAVTNELKITKVGERLLKPYKTQTAIIMAAGMASRFAPLSYEKPKGLLVVKGEVLVERQIRQLNEAGISDITVVVGYMKEQFFYLEKKYNVSIVINEDYYRYNNTSTLIRVLDKLKNTYICSSDNYFADNPFEEYVYDSYYSAVFCPGVTDEWGLKTDKKGLITEVVHHPEDCWCMMGHAYFSDSYSKVFKNILKTQYEKGDTRDILWEGLYERNIDKLPMYIRKYDPDKVLEFDSLDDLRKFDAAFMDNTGSAIMRDIAEALGCKESDIREISVIKNELPIYPFRFKVKGKWYMYNNSSIASPRKARGKGWEISIFEEFHK